MADKMDIAAARLDTFCIHKGWSLWGVELRLALEQLTKGTDAQKSLAAVWQSTAPNTLASLVVQVASDRNDATFSYDAFYWKCLDSFPRFTIATWLPPYLMYRSLSHVGNPEESLPFILSRELTSSLIDYYEVVIETLVTIAVEPVNLEHLRPSAIRVIDSLVKDGFSDCRLQKLRVALTGSIAPNTGGASEYTSPLIHLVSDACSSRIRWNEVPSDLPPFLQRVLEDIRQCNEQGTQAQEAITRVTKLGVNLKSLDVGLTIGLCPQLYASDITSGAILPLAMTLSTCCWELADAAALDDKTIRILLESSAQDSFCAMHVQATGLLNVLNGQPVESLEIEDSLLYLWLGRQLVTLTERYNGIWCTGPA